MSDIIPTVFQFLTEHAGALIAAATSIVGGFAILAAFTPNTSDDKIVDFLLKVINFLGANFGKAKNDPSAK